MDDLLSTAAPRRAIDVRVRCGNDDATTAHMPAPSPRQPSRKPAGCPLRIRARLARANAEAHEEVAQRAIGAADMGGDPVARLVGVRSCRCLAAGQARAAEVLEALHDALVVLYVLLVLRVLIEAH